MSAWCADDILTNLLVLARVEVNDKLVSEALAFKVRPVSYTRSAVRWLQGESRCRNYEALRALFGAAMNVIELLYLKREDVAAERLLDAFPKALEGVHNMSQTYRDDVETASKLSILATDVAAFQQRMRASHAHTRSASPASSPRSRSPS